MSFKILPDQLELLRLHRPGLVSLMIHEISPSINAFLSRNSPSRLEKAWSLQCDTQFFRGTY